jgi:hypothetical protein
VNDDPTPARPRARLRAVEGELAEPDQVPRLQQFRLDHPEVTVELDGFWRATIPAEKGSTTLRRYELRTLLDMLEELLP